MTLLSGETSASGETCGLSTLVLIEALASCGGSKDAVMAQR